MAIQTFTWCPRVDPTGTVSFRTKSAKFGDGYEQIAQDGINNRTQTWPLTFLDTEPRARQIKGFLDAHKGAQPFYWTPPLGEQGLYRCKTYQATAHGAGLFSIAAEFEQAFHP